MKWKHWKKSKQLFTWSNQRDNVQFIERILHSFNVTYILEFALVKKPLKNTIVCFFVIWTVLNDIKIFEEFYMIGGWIEQSRRGESSDKITKRWSTTEVYLNIKLIMCHQTQKTGMETVQAYSNKGYKMARFILETVIRLGRASKNGSSSDNPTVTDKYGQSGRIIYPHDLSR